jgi:hypothetical protein
MSVFSFIFSGIFKRPEFNGQQAVPTMKSPLGESYLSFKKGGKRGN